MATLDAAEYESFEAIKQTDANSGWTVADHFPDDRKMVEIGSGALKPAIDYKLTRYACYLIVQNGDPRKEIIALGQTYFAIQTRRQKLADAFNQLDENGR